MESETNSSNSSKKESNWATRIGGKTQPPESLHINDEQHFQDKGDVTTLKEYINETNKRVGQTDYFRRRGISDQTVERLNLGYDPAFRTKEGVEFVTWQAVIIPTSEYSYTARNTELSAELHNRIRKKGPGTIYNSAALQSGKPVFIVEGEIDALSLIEAGAEALALSSTANINQLIKALEKDAPPAGLILSLDNDEQGRQTSAELGRVFSSLNINYIEANVCGEYKDPNEALTMARGQFIQAVQATQDSITEALQIQERAEREAYLNNCSTDHLEGIVHNIKKGVSSPCIPTGFDHLDMVLDGGLYEGLYILGAASSMGKTAFALQIADHMAQAGNDVLILSLETPRIELIARSISRLTFMGGPAKGKPKTTREITVCKYQQSGPAEQDLIKASITRYSEYAQHIYICEGRGEIGTEQIRETLNKHIRFTGNKPVILIDCLQLLARNDRHITSKQNMDKVLLELKRISRDYGLPVLTINCFESQSPDSPVKIEDWESWASDYSSDVVIGLKPKGAGEFFVTDHAPNEQPREIELKILKNRHGAADSVMSYNYYPMYNCFMEVPQ